MASRSTKSHAGLCIASLMIILIAAVLVPHPVDAQVCTGDVNLTTQAEVDAFSCSEHTGYLAVQGADITNLNGLSSLTTVGGYLNIGFNPLLTNVDGLSSLTAVGRYLTITYNSALTNLNGLSSLTSVGEGIGFAHNDALTNLDGLSGLTSVGGSVGIDFMDALTNVDGLSSLTSALGLNIRFNPALANVDGLSSLTTLEYLTISNNDLLTNLNGLSSLTTVGGDFNIGLNIVNNPALIHLDGLSALTSVGGGGLSIYNNAALTNVNGLSSLTSVGDHFPYSLNLDNNVTLDTCCGLYPLLIVNGAAGPILIENNAPGCNSVQEILDGGQCTTSSTPVPQQSTWSNAKVIYRE